MTTVPVLQREIQARIQTPSALQRWLPVLGVAALLLVGGYLRLHDLGRRSISHPEMYVPGIHMPVEISQPRQRLTLTSVITGTFTSDTHPAGFYVMMWMWTKCFGTSIWSIRLPAALLGIGCIPLLLWLGFLTGQRHAAWIAAALLAVNGHHVFWSQTARMYSMACFLGLLATVLLVLMARRDQSSKALSVLYVLVLLLGVTTHVFFWLVLGTHMAWVLLNGWGRAPSLPRLLNLLILAFILGSPLLAFAAYQSGTTVAPLSNDVGIYAREFVSFGFVLPQLEFSTGLYLPGAPYPAVANAHIPLWRMAFVALSALLLLIGLLAMREAEPHKATLDDGWIAIDWPKLWVFAATLATLAIAGFVMIAEIALRAPHSTLNVTKLMSIIPLLVAGSAILFRKVWGGIPPPRWWKTRGVNVLIPMLASVPFVLLAIVAKLKPILNARGMSVLVPYLVLVMAAGIVRVAKRTSTMSGAVLFLLLLAVHIVGLRDYGPMVTDPVDYKELVAAVSAQHNTGDLVFIQPGLWSTPFLYYLTPNHYSVVGTNFDTAIASDPDCRVWVIHREHEPVSEAIRRAVEGRDFVRSIVASHAIADLYCLRTPGPATENACSR